MDERNIIIKAQNGDINAFEEIFRLYSQKAIRTSYLATGNRQMSEDIVQDVFYKCYFELKNLKSPELFKYWFYKMLTRYIWRYCKKERRLLPVENMLEEASNIHINDLFDDFWKKEDAKLIYNVIYRLEDKYKTVIILYYYNDMSIKEISKILGCFEGTVKSRLYNARNKVKEKLLKSNNQMNYLFGRECKVNEARG